MQENDDGSPGSLAVVAAWSALRDAIAEEFIGQLPPAMTMPELALLLGATTVQVEELIVDGEVTVSGIGASRMFRPAENRALLRRELLLRLPLPAA